MESHALNLIAQVLILIKIEYITEQVGRMRFGSGSLLLSKLLICEDGHTCCMSILTSSSGVLRLAWLFMALSTNWLCTSRFSNCLSNCSIVEATFSRLLDANACVPHNHISTLVYRKNLRSLCNRSASLQSSLHEENPRDAASVFKPCKVSR